MFEKFYAVVCTSYSTIFIHLVALMKEWKLDKLCVTIIIRGTNVSLIICQSWRSIHIFLYSIIILILYLNLIFLDI